MSWWQARWWGTLIGLVGGTIVGLVIIAWKINMFAGIAATAIAVPLTMWLCRHSLVHIFGRRNIWLDRPVLPGEYAVRFVSGFFVGGIFAFFLAARLCRTVWALTVVSIALATVCGVLAMILGDRFWTRY